MKSKVLAIAIKAPAKMASFGPVRTPKLIVVVLPGPVSIVFEPSMTLGTQLLLKMIATTAAGTPRASAATVQATVIIGFSGAVILVDKSEDIQKGVTQMSEQGPRE